ncbi:hypothetical protein DL765_001105 [Monosporascus sp. GIB2]|nr:hypothetical protein DL765_001105 [Monosporascus sp. GIB2]
MDHLSIGENLFIRLCPDISKGLGMFAARKLSKGLRILTDQVTLTYESREDICKPVAWIYWNETLGAMTVHALRDIEAGEEVTLSYIQESIYLRTAEPHSRLMN